MDCKEDDELIKSKYEEIIDSMSFKVAIFGIEHVPLAHDFMQVLIYNEVLDNRDRHNYSTVDTIENTIKYYKSTKIVVESWLYSNIHRDGGFIKQHVLNPFLTQEAYNHKAIQYSDILESYTLNRTDFINHSRYGQSFDDYSTNIDEKEEKYYKTTDDINNIPLKRKHIMEADAFMILYDVRYQNELNKTTNLLNEIFEVKGYDKLLDKLQKDQMCFFPISLIGVQHNYQQPVSIGAIIDNNIPETISRSQINNIAMEYCVDNERMQLYQNDSTFDAAINAQKFAELEAFTETVVNYYYYRSLNEHQISKLKKYTSSCLIL
eukprot:183399_1